PLGLRADRGSAVAADVEVRPRGAIACARDDHALAADLGGDERPGLGQLAAVGGAEPEALEDALLLQRKDPGISVGDAGKRGDQRGGGLTRAHADSSPRWCVT